MVRRNDREVARGARTKTHVPASFMLRGGRQTQGAGGSELK